ncbi:MAG: H-type small acid-soluble spore protein [Bacillota bacterium]
MNYEKVQQILKSPETVRVLYRGKSVWIESLNPGNETATVSADGGTMTVPVQELIEG